jgi:hypothetical protein
MWHQVIDTLFLGAFNVADHYDIPHIVFHTSGLPIMDSWQSFFIPKPTHIPMLIGCM